MEQKIVVVYIPAHSDFSGGDGAHDLITKEAVDLKKLFEEGWQLVRESAVGVTRTATCNCALLVLERETPKKPKDPRM